FSNAALPSRFRSCFCNSRRFFGPPGNSTRCRLNHEIWRTEMPVIAFTTFAIMKAPYGDPIVKGFEDLTPIVFTEAERSPGFIDRAKEVDEVSAELNDGQLASSVLSNFERDWGKWGKFAVPRFYDGGFEIATDTRAGTLSLWSDIHAVHTFVYRSLHRTALAKRHDWFRKPDLPTYSIWRVPDHITP